MGVLVGYWNSFLLLTAFAFENLYRGWLVAQGRSWRELRGKRSHQLVRHLSEVVVLTDEERNFVMRLETYLVWAGRYTVPWEFEAFAEASSRMLEGLHSGDFQTASGLYCRVGAEIGVELAKAGLLAKMSRTKNGSKNVQK